MTYSVNYGAAKENFFETFYDACMFINELPNNSDGAFILWGNEELLMSGTWNYFTGSMINEIY